MYYKAKSLVLVMPDEGPEKLVGCIVRDSSVDLTQDIGQGCCFPPYVYLRKPNHPPCEECGETMIMIGGHEEVRVLITDLQAVLCIMEKESERRKGDFYQIRSTAGQFAKY